MVDGVRRGASAVLVVRGEPGTGKTALLDFTAGLDTSFQVVRAAGAESETELAFGGLHRLCGTMLDLLGRLPGPQREALEVAFGMRAGTEPDRFLMGLAVLGLLAESAAGQPLICVIDDAHWLDQASRQALGFAARRLATEPLLVLFAAPEPITELDDLPAMTLGGLRDADARALLASVLRYPLDDRVRDQVIAEAKGIPGALLGLLHEVSPAQLAGGLGLPDVLSGSTSGPWFAELSELPAETRQLLVLAAADPTGDPALLWRAAAQAGIASEAAVPAVEAGLITFGSRVVFRDHAVRSAAYRVARLRERRSAHRALAQATDPCADPDRRAWHRAKALTEPDEDVAAELERTAGRAQARGGLAAAAAFLERAATATADPARRAERSLAAASVMLAAGEPSAAAKLLDLTENDTLDDHRQARADLVRARLAFSLNRGGDASQPLLDAARQLSRFDRAQSRTAYLEAIRAALSAGRRAAPGATVADVARAAREGCPGTDLPAPSDTLLAGLAASFSGELAAGAPLLRRAMSGLEGERTDPADLSVLSLACAGALQLWDDRAGEALASRYVELARTEGALADLPSALNALSCVRLLAGDLAEADSLATQAQAISEATGIRAAPYGALGPAALRGHEDRALALIETSGQDAARRGEGLGVAAAKWAAALLHNGLGQYAQAASAAEDAIEHAGPPVAAGWPMAELVEAAARSGQPERAEGVMRSLSRIALAAGTDWALGVQARSQALLSDREDLYQAALDHLGRSRARVDLARAHLVYGEWLRRENRRVDARHQLRLAEEMLGTMGAAGFAERARRELVAAGETARKRGAGTDRDLTPQEMQIARYARDGRTNREIGAELFLSARTVEWHLHNVCAKLGISSRRQLRDALPGAAATARLQVQHDVAGGLGAADEDLAVGGELERIRGVGDVPGQQRSDAGVADAGAAAPAGGDVAGVGQVEHAAPVVAELRGDAAAGEGNERPVAVLGSRRLVRRLTGVRGDPGGHGGQRPEQFGVDRRRAQADRGQGVAHVGHERRRPADVGVRVGRDVQRGQGLLGEMPGGGVGAAALGGGGRAVEHVLAGVRQRGQQGVRLGREGMLPRSARPVQPPDGPLAAVRGEPVQHGQDRRDADAGGDEQHRAGALVEDEVAAGRGDVEVGSRFQVVVQVAAGHAVRLLLDADPVRAAGRRRGQRVAADRDRRPGAADPQREVLARPGRRKGRAVIGGEVDRAHPLGFPDDPGDAQLAEPGPGRPGVVAGRGQQVAERALPARAEGGDLQGEAQLAPVGVGEVEQGVGVGHRQGTRTGPGLDDRLAGLDVPFGDDAHVEAGTMVADQQRGQLGLAQPHADPVAGDAGLGHLELRLADAVPVADAHLVVGQAVNGQVLAEHPVGQVVPPEVLPPVLIGLHLVDEHGPLLATVALQVALAVAVDVETAHHPRPGHRLLPDARVHGLAVPRHVLGHPDVDRQQNRHLTMIPLGTGRPHPGESLAPGCDAMEPWTVTPGPGPG
jgi:DNA-binding CsgD family transcriptional regulator